MSQNIAKILIGIFFYFSLSYSLFDKNSCNNFVDYFALPFGDICFKNPELFLSTVGTRCTKCFQTQILDRRRIPYENHSVTTEDGYILSMVRMPKTNSKGVLVLSHCLTLDSVLWFMGYHQSVGLTFYQADYEIWLPNFRGNRFSDLHRNVTISSKKYWDFSFHEIGFYDFPAILDYVKSTTNQKLIFMGHSLSSTAALVYASLKPEEAAKNVDTFIILGPTSYMKHAQTPGRYVALALPFFKKFFAEPLGWYSVFKPLGLLISALKKLAMVFRPLQIPVVFLAAFSWGHLWKPFQMDSADLPMLISIAPQGTSWKNFYHYGQLLTSGKFQMFDYGAQKNRKVYGSKSPHQYNLSTISVPFLVVHGTEDTMADPKDMMDLYENLPEKARIHGKMEIQGFNHGDFLYGRDRFTKVYFRILEFLERTRNK